MRKKICVIVALFIAQVYAEPMKTPQHVFGGALPIYEARFVDENRNDYPFPTEMTFRHFADHSIDPATEFFDPDVVQRGDTIFLSDWYIPWFTRYVHPKIKHPYILISNDTDSWHPDSGVWDYDERNGWFPPVDATRTLLYDSKVAAWFCKNMIFSRHPKIFQIPIGQNIYYWGKFPEKDYLLSLMQKEPFSKPYLMYMNMQLASNPVRSLVASLFQDKPYCLSRINNGIQNPTIRTQFYDELSQTQFTPCPPGYGPDIVRLWEAVVLDCIPIVKHCELDDLYTGLPVLFVHEWEEIDEDMLKQKAEELQSKHFGKEKALFDYWAVKITEVQEKVREGANDFSTLEATRFKHQDLADLKDILEDHFSYNDRLLCKGAAMGLRAFEIAAYSPFLFQFYVHDRWGAWGHEDVTAHLSRFSQHDLLNWSYKITSINYWDDPFSVCGQRADSKLHVFFDLTYLRFDLKNDLENAYVRSIPNTLICGNLGGDSFVTEVLARFSRKFGVSIQKTGDIWFFKK